MAECEATSFLGPNQGPKIRNLKIRALFLISQNQSIDNGLMSYCMKFELDWPKNGGNMAKKGMPIYGHMGQIWPNIELCGCNFSDKDLIFVLLIIQVNIDGQNNFQAKRT